MEVLKQVDISPEEVGQWMERKRQVQVGDEHPGMADIMITDGDRLIFNPSGPDPLKMKGYELDLPEDGGNLGFAFGGQPVIYGDGPALPVIGFSMPGGPKYNVLENMGLDVTKLADRSLALPQAEPDRASSTPLSCSPTRRVPPLQYDRRLTSAIETHPASTINTPKVFSPPPQQIHQAMSARSAHRASPPVRYITEPSHENLRRLPGGYHHRGLDGESVEIVYERVNGATSRPQLPQPRAHMTSHRKSHQALCGADFLRYSNAALQQTQGWLSSMLPKSPESTSRKRRSRRPKQSPKKHDELLKQQHAKYIAQNAPAVSRQVLTVPPQDVRINHHTVPDIASVPPPVYAPSPGAPRVPVNIQRPIVSANFPSTQILPRDSAHPSRAGSPSWQLESPRVKSFSGPPGRQVSPAAQRNTVMHSSIQHSNAVHPVVQLSSTPYPTQHNAAQQIVAVPRQIQPAMYSTQPDKKILMMAPQGVGVPVPLDTQIMPPLLKEACLQPGQISMKEAMVTSGVDLGVIPTLLEKPKVCHPTLLGGLTRDDILRAKQEAIREGRVQPDRLQGQVQHMSAADQVMFAANDVSIEQKVATHLQDAEAATTPLTQELSHKELQQLAFMEAQAVQAAHLDPPTPPKGPIRTRTFEIGTPKGETRSIEVVTLCEEPQIELLRSFLDEQESECLKSIVDAVDAKPEAPNNLMCNQALDKTAQMFIDKLVKRVTAMIGLDAEDVIAFCPSLVTTTAMDATRDYANIIRMYIDDATEDSKSDFPFLGITVCPQRGSALRWCAKNEKGFRMARAMHSEAVGQGQTRRLITLYLR